MRTHLFLIAGLLLTPAAVNAAETQTTMDSKAAFARLKGLVGEWQADTSKGKVRVSYELIAGGTSLVERDSSDKMPVMVTVYHMDGNRLLLEHYCMAGNQPRMEARSFNAETGELRFQFVDATNLANSNASHMHSAAFRIADGDHLSADWDFYEGGQRKMTESFRYTRVK